MTIKMYQVFKVLDIYKRVKELTVSAKVAYKFNKLCIGLNSDANFYQEEVDKLIQQYADREEDGSVKKSEDGGVKIQADKVETVQKEINNLWDLEVDAPNIQFTIEELDDLKLSIEDFNAMLPFIKED